MIVAILLLAVLVGTILFHILSPWWFTPIASNWSSMDDTLLVTFWVTGIVFIAVMLFTVWCVYRYRHREGVTAEYEPENKKLEIWLTVLTSLGVAVMLAPGLWVWKDFVTVPPGAEDRIFEVLGKQWEWSYRFPGADGVLGRTEPRLVSDDNPFGIDPNDPNSMDDVLVDDSEVHIPMGKPIKVVLRSLDVLHDFYVPQFRAKMDMVPGMVTYFWFTPTKEGTYEMLCFELCGTYHYSMRGSIVVEEESTFRAWLREQPTFAQSQAALNGAGEETKLVSNASALDAASSGAAR
jgi:cytochrome c oxidase subunit 2